MMVNMKSRCGTFSKAENRHLHLKSSLLLAWLIASPALAQGDIGQYPFCIQGVDNPGWSGCSFNTLQACQATASGTESECLSNPWYRPDAGIPSASPIDQAGPFAPLPVGPPPN